MAGGRILPASHAPESREDPSLFVVVRQSGEFTSSTKERRRYQTVSIPKTSILRSLVASGIPSSSL